MYTINDIDKLKDNDIKKISYAEAKDIVTVLSTTNYYDLTNQQTLEKIETYRIFVAIIITRVNMDDFNELSDVENKNEKEHFLWNLWGLQSNFTYMLSINSQLHDTLHSARRIYRDVSQQEKKMSTHINAAIERLKDSEHNTLTHVMALLGIFTAIITVIITLIVSSSSWINNANQSDAFLAFTVPTVIAITAVSVMMLFVYLFIHNDKTAYEKEDGTEFEKEVGKEGEKKKKRSNSIDKSKMISICIMVGIILLFSAILSLLFINTSHTKYASHVQYIISPDQYEIVEESEESSDNCQHNTDCNCHTKIEIKKYFEITFEGKKYRFEYKEKLKHDGNLYFCEEHEILE